MCGDLENISDQKLEMGETVMNKWKSVCTLMPSMV